MAKSTNNFKLFGRLRIICGLLLISLGAAAGLFGLPSEQVYAQEEQPSEIDSDGDGVIDTYDNCPNDPTSAGIDGPCPGSGSQVSSSSESSTTGTTNTDGGVSQYYDYDNCTNYVQVDCGAGSNAQDPGMPSQGGSPAPIKPQFAYLTQGDPYAPVLNIPGRENQFCNPNSENCDIGTVKPYGGCITIITEGFGEENDNGQSCSYGPMSKPAGGEKVWEKYPVWEDDRYLGEALRESNIATLGGVVTCENLGKIASTVTSVAECSEGDAYSCANAIGIASEIKPSGILTEKGTQFVCEKAIEIAGGQDFFERQKGIFLADMKQWCSDYGYQFDPVIYCPSLMMDYDNCAARAVSMGISTLPPDTAIKYRMPPNDGQPCSLN